MTDKESKPRVDSLGRRIPTYDRSAAGKKSAATRRKRHGNDHARAGAIGGSRRTRGYFGKLKDEGKEDELRAISKVAAEARKQAREHREHATDRDES